MSRSGYIEDFDDVLQFGRWRGIVASTIRSKRGQAFLAEMLTALDAMPEKKLIRGSLEIEGAVCAIGAVGKSRGVDMTGLDPDDPDGVANAFGITAPLAQEIVYMNDDALFSDPPERRWEKMREWVVKQIRTDSSLSNNSEAK
jgi:hypothetical protein